MTRRGATVNRRGMVDEIRSLLPETSHRGSLRLAAGPHAAVETAERARRQDRLQRAEAAFEPLPVDADVARACGRVYAAVLDGGTKARGRRAFDLLIAATGLANDLSVYTRNPDDFADVTALIDVVAVS